MNQLKNNQIKRNNNQMFIHMFISQLQHLYQWPVRDYYYSTSAEIKIAESLPEVLGFENKYPTTQAWIDVINGAQETIKIGAYYSSMWCLNNGTSADFNYTCPPDGDEVIAALEDAANRGVQVQMVIDSSSFYDDDEIARLQASIPNIDINYINIGELFGGVQHSKFIIADDESFYLGSANFDWRALTYVKELGFVMKDKTIAGDLLDIYNQMWLLSTPGRYDDPFQVETYINGNYLTNQSVQPKFYQENEAQINQSQGFLGLSPPGLLTTTRTHDIDALVKLVNSAKHSIVLETMNYGQTDSYSSQKVIDQDLTPALINAALRKVNISLLMQYKTGKTLQGQLDTLKTYGVKVYMMEMPQFTDYPEGWDHTELIHSKFVVVDNTSSFVTTSNLEPSYFTDTVGISFVLENNTEIAEQLGAIFQRDIASNYTSEY